MPKPLVLTHVPAGSGKTTRAVSGTGESVLPTLANEPLVEGRHDAWAAGLSRAPSASMQAAGPRITARIPLMATLRMRDQSNGSSSRESRSRWHSG